MNTITSFFAVATLLKIVSGNIETQDVEQIRIRTRRFTGGHTMTVQPHLFTVSIEYSWKYVCTGSIITDRIILTAASCIVQKWYNKLTVRVGSAHIGIHGTSYRVDKISSHPQFIYSSQINDAALLWLNESINYKLTKAIPISLFDQFEKVVLGSQGLSYGWNIIKNDENHLEGDLMVTNVRIVQTKKCAERLLDKKSIRRVMRGKICAYSSEAGMCSKDIGGPLVVNGLQAGIAITDRNCSTLPSTLAYMEISHIRDWISNEIVALSDSREPPVKLYPLSIQEIDSNRELQGKSISFEKVPFLVSILTIVGNILTCTGTIIGPSYVLTSTRCSSAGKSTFYVRSGSGNWTHGGQKHIIVDARWHYDYRVKNLTQSSNDIAILQVEPPFSFSKTTKMVELVKKDHVAHYGTPATIYGWDSKIDEARRSNRRRIKGLQSLDLRVIDNDECGGLLRNQDSLSDAGQICASNRMGICIGPLGAPLMVGERQIGILAWNNENCADYRFPGVFTDVAAYKNWIDSQISYEYIKNDELR
ncbi:hypothetical protein QAD02_009083 [Eretmocerus hayati]|uniref:Uncharacterized protein n=1 Tax=Eretmocerus hayati TaxID=131215 RepID=A0ACC2N8A5_9HYME|nr:hypothetical protein QAD02_009083 [Eretmocerus hayati]